MTKIEDMELDVENLKEFFKEMSQFMKKWSSNDPNLLQELATQLSNLSKSFSDFQEQNKTFQQQLSEISTKQANVDSRLNSLENNCSNLATNLGQMTEVLDSLQTSVTNITDTVIPELENKIEQSGGSSGSEWTLIYDMDSPDPEINRGETGGVGYNEAITAFKGINMMPYNYIRLKLKFGSYFSYFVIYIGELKTSDRTEYNRFFAINEEAIIIYAGSLKTNKIAEDNLEISLSSIYKLVYSTSAKTWKLTKTSDDITDYHVCKIEAKI